MPNTGTESQFEETVIDRLRALGYRYQYGGEVARPNPQTVVLTDVLRDYLGRRYRHLPPAAVEDAVEQIANPPGLTAERRNMAFQDMLRGGLILNYTEGDEPKSAHIYPADFEQPELNDFLVVNQLPIHSPTTGNDRRPDLIVYINGLPLVVWELKNPFHPKPTVNDAHNQLQHYISDIGQLFAHNGLCVISDGNTTLHGVHTASLEWYAAWKSIDGRTVEPATTGSAKTLIEGLFPKDRLLNYLRHFLVHEVENTVIRKKGAKYHQFFAVNFAVEQALRAMTPGADKRAGVVWHTQGSGKSLEMVFMIGILRRWPGLNPSIIVQVDRTDLDDQLYGSLVAAQALIGDVVQAESVDDLRARLRTQGGEIMCTTIEKFTLKSGETRHPLLSERHNLLIVADEAHRTQYGFSTEIKRRDGGGLYTSQGHALNMRQALPNAAYIGFTGTPIDKEDANTIQIFGDYIHIYDMQQAKDDNAVVPIYYEARHIPLRLIDAQIDDKVDALAEEAEVDAASLEMAKAKWSAVEQAAGVKERLDILARDLLTHFNSHQATLDGKAMIVCMSRRNAVALYAALTAFTDCPPVKVVMTGDLGEDPEAWSRAGHLTTKAARDDIKRYFIDPADPLKLVIVCDMWLTGFDAPCVNTLYVDKLMKGHNLMQAIARVNRIFGDKEGGLIVDYIGIDDRLKEATRKYTVGGGRGSLTGDLQHQAMTYFLGQLKATRAHMPDLAALITKWGEDDVSGRGEATRREDELANHHLTELPRPYNLPDLSDLPGLSDMPRAHYQMLRRRDENLYANWRSLTNIQLEDLAMFVYGTLIADEQRKDGFLNDEYRLSKAFSLVKHLLIGQQNTEEVGFYQLIRKQLRKLDPAATQQARTLEGALRDLLDDSIAAQPAVDIYAVAGLDRPDVSILDEKFVVGHGGDALKEDLQVRLLAKLLGDEIEARRRRNIVRYRSYKDMLEDALRQYNNRTITAQEVVEVMRQIRGEQQAEVQRQHKLGLNDEEIAFYDVIALGEEVDLHQTDEWIADLVRQVVKAVRNALQVDWTKPHRSNIEAEVQSAVGRVLRRNQIRGEQFNFLRARLMKQAKATYERWPVVM